MSETQNQERPEAKLSVDLASITKKFDLLKELVSGVASGHLNGLLINGSPGIGKTYEITNYVRHKLIRESKEPVKCTHVKGHITPMKLYEALYDNRALGEIVIFDDCDNVFTDQKSLNILKSSVDTTYPRTIYWGSDRTKAEKQFFFHGGVIIITNSSFDDDIHYQALLDRIYRYDMKVSQAEKVARVLDIASKTNVVSKDLSLEVAYWMLSHSDQITYASLRTLEKILKLAKFSPNWKSLAAMTLLDKSEEK